MPHRSLPPQFQEYLGAFDGTLKSLSSLFEAVSSSVSHEHNLDALLKKQVILPLAGNGKKNAQAKRSAKLNRKNTSVHHEELSFRDEDLEQFTYFLSHHLRSPVASIRGLVDVFQKPHSDAKTRKKCLEGIEKSIEQIDDVIKDLNQVLQLKRQQ